MQKLLIALGLALSLGLAACSKTEDAAKPEAAAATPQTYDLVAAGAKGFAVGPMMSASTVYVLFDPQCPHCGHLWQAAQPLAGKVKFVWAPVAFINGNSAPQGAALLSATDPVQAMNIHEASLLAGNGGTVPREAMRPEQEAVIRKNTEIFGQLKAESVPFIVARNAATGQVISRAGALDTAALSQWLGLDSK